MPHGFVIGDRKDDRRVRSDRECACDGLVVSFEPQVGEGAVIAGAVDFSWMRMITAILGCHVRQATDEQPAIGRTI